MIKLKLQTFLMLNVIVQFWYIKTLHMQLFFLIEGHNSMVFLIHFKEK